MTTYAATQKGVTTALLAASTTGTGVAVLIPITSNILRFTVIGAGTIASGTLVIEEADAPDYAGTWSAISTITLSTLSGGAQQVIHANGTFGAVRGRFSANVSGAGGSAALEVVSN